MKVKGLFLAALASCCAYAAVPPASAGEASYPVRQIRLVVPFGPGSGTDLIARVVAQKLEQQLGVPIVTENRDGAGGVIGTASVVKAPPDGYTVVMASNAVTIAPHLYANPPFDPQRDLVPVTNVATMPLALVTSANGPFRTLPELFEYIKANPGKANFASSGLGSQSQLEVEALKQLYDLDAVHVPYKSTGLAATDTVSQVVTFYLPAYPAIAGMVEAGRMRALAIGGEARSPIAPDVPTFAEVLGRDDVSPQAWFGFMVPRGTPPEIVARLNDEIVKAMESPEVRKGIEDVRATIRVVPSAEFADQVAQESSKWRTLVETLGLRNQ